MTVRSEHPRPQFVRDNWMNLNGEWEFEFDDQRIGRREKWHLGERTLSQTIQVPFSFESKLSGIDKQEFHDVVWYQRKIDIPKSWHDKRVLLHFGAVDYLADVWVNGQHVVSHEGGHTPFEADITDALQLEGDNVIVVRAEDFSLDLSLPRGKQYWENESDDIFYTRTTGIWQTV